MNGKIASNNGNVQISPEVIATYAGMTAVECFGIVGMAVVSMKKGFAGLLKDDHITKGVDVKIENNEISLDFHVIVAYSVNILAVADNLVESVKYKVGEFTGMKVKCVNVYVEGVRVID